MSIINLKSTGVYIAFPTTPELKRTYRNHKSMVNNCHTKVGVTKDSFHNRGNEYRRTFDGEVEFVPLLELPEEKLPEVEAILIQALKSKYGTVGRTREWFDTNNRQEIVQIISELLNVEINVSF